MWIQSYPSYYLIIPSRHVICSLFPNELNSNDEQHKQIHVVMQTKVILLHLRTTKVTGQVEEPFSEFKFASLIGDIYLLVTISSIYRMLRL